MFEALKNLGNLNELLGNVRQMQEQRSQKSVTADAGAGMVQATVNGRMELTKLQIDRSKIDVADTEMLEDVIVAAVNAAQTRAAEMVKQEMQKRAGDLGIPPG